MRSVGYHLLKYWVLFGLYYYYKKIKVVGLGHIPKGKPVLFLSNHQNALIDVLLIVTLCGRKPWFLTRADVFKSLFFHPFFHFLQMLPIYRIRDGKDSLFKNNAIFNRCGNILRDNGCIVIFPEANHSLKRYIRPLSKGFTRILEATFAENPDKDVWLVPVGQNYQNAVRIGDVTALYFGKPILVKAATNFKDRSKELKQVVADELKKLTTHIEPLEAYDQKLQKLESLHCDFTNPANVNAWLSNDNVSEESIQNRAGTNAIFKGLFYVINLPLLFLWRLLLKPRVPEREFMATYRFGFGMLGYPIFYLLLIFVLTWVLEWKTACLIVISHAVMNFILLKTMGVTSSARRK